MSDDQRISVQRSIPASAADVFEVLSNPRRHPDLDGSGFIRSVVHGDRITETGQVFTVDMEGDHMGGEYQTENHVTGYDHNRLLSWQTAPAGSEPPGWEWTWDLEAQGPGSTLVTHTYDWSRVDDPQILSKVRFPLVSQHAMETSLGKLAESVSG